MPLPEVEIGHCPFALVAAPRAEKGLFTVL